jgi:hypothetical protein
MGNVLLGCALCVVVSAAEPAKPQPFEDALREAVKEYRAGKLDQARAALDKASELLEKQRSGQMAETFPDPPEGWTSGEPEKSEIPAFLGGGRSLKKIYREKSGRKEIQLEVLYDSSLGKMMMGLMANDVVAEAQGFKVRRIGGDRALLKEAAEGGELNLPVEDRLLVKLTAKGGAGEKEMLALAREIDRRSLKEVK